MKIFLEKINLKLVLLIGLIFLTSLTYSFGYKIRPAVDAKAYQAIAVNIVSGNGFRESVAGDIVFDRSIQRAGPAYEYFLAGLYSVFGIHYEVVWIVQAILHALSAWFLYKISILIFTEKGETIGLIAAVIYGFHPDLIEASAMLLTETLYLFLTVLTVYFFVKVYQERAWFWTSALAIVLALGILARPPLILLVPIICFLYFTRKQWVNQILFICLFLLCLTPWSIRNYQIYDQVILTTLIGEYNIWVGNTMLADGGQLSGGYNPFDEYVAKYGFLTVHTASSQAFKSFLIEHPGRFVELSLIRTVRYFSLIRPMGFWFYQTGWPQLIFVTLSGFSIAGLFTFGLAGLIRMQQAKNPLFNYFIALVVTAPLLLLPTVVQSRYRFQIYPFFAIAAGYFLSSWLKNKSWYKDRAWLISVLFFGAITLIDILLSAEVVIDRLKTLL